MITEEQYLKALKTVRDYLSQIEKEIQPKDEFLDSLVIKHENISVGLRNVIRSCSTDLTFRELKDKGAEWLGCQWNYGVKRAQEISKIFEENGYIFK